MTTDDIVAIAQTIAVEAHAGQADKAGHPYITHLARVAERVAGDPAAEAVAWLHDVVEESGASLDELREAGMPERVVAAVDAMSKRAGEERDGYYARVAANPLALKVKFADLADNSDPERLAQLDPTTRARLEAKHLHAREALATARTS